MQADFVVLSKENKPIATVEARARKNTDEQWAKQFAANMLESQLLTAHQFFILATLQDTYIWKSIDSPTTEPNCTLPTKQLIGKYFPEDTEIQMTPQSFEMMVFSWLSRIVQENPTNETVFPPQLIHLGLSQAVHDGSIVAMESMG